MALASASASATADLLAAARRPVDGAARRLAALHVLDWLAATRAGTLTEEGRAFAAYGAARAAGTATAIGAGPREPEVAALVNGALAMALELDDVHLGVRIHPSTVVIPAAVAVAERAGSGGRALLEAVVRGYEVAIRVAAAAGPGHRRHWHSTATCGSLGAAAAVADLLALDDERWLDALGTAGTQAGGLWQCRLEPSMSKLFHAGRAAQAGVAAADLAATGVTGARHVLDGPLGFLAAMCEGDGDVEAFAAGGDWRIGETAIKAWPTCAYAHPAIEATLALKARAGDATPDGFEVETYRDAVEFSSFPEPTTAARARFSIEHCVATAWLRGTVGLEDFAPAGLAADDVADLRRRVHVAERCGDGDPDEPWGAVVTLRGPGARSDAATCSAPRGLPENPLGEPEIVAKARSLLLAAGCREQEADAAIAAALALADGGNPRDMTMAVTGGDDDAGN